ncbi:hypothetical protein ACH3XW_17385 [Acanthocheilonema viteae]
MIHQHTVMEPDILFFYFVCISKRIFKADRFIWNTFVIRIDRTFYIMLSILLLYDTMPAVRNPSLLNYMFFILVLRNIHQYR